MLCGFYFLFFTLQLFFRKFLTNRPLTERIQKMDHSSAPSMLASSSAPVSLASSPWANLHGRKLGAELGAVDAGAELGAVDAGAEHATPRGGASAWTASVRSRAAPRRASRACPWRRAARPRTPWRAAEGARGAGAGASARDDDERRGRGSGAPREEPGSGPWTTSLCLRCAVAAAEAKDEAAVAARRPLRPQLCAVQQNIKVRFGVHIPAMEF